jgi:myo-inositol-1(or 4)-monophosphatase
MTAELELALRAARTGGEIVTKYLREGVTMRTKETYNLVSDADVESERAIAGEIRQQFPDDAILGEELHSDDITAHRLWVIDPLDGTNNFAHAIPHFAISIAFYEGGQPQCGVVLNPVRNDLYTATRGGGAFYNGERVHVTDDATLDKNLIGVGFYYDRGAMMKATLAAIEEIFSHDIHGIRRFGTASLDLCQVGMGMFGAYFEYELAPWDFAAGRLFVEEAGGKVTDCRGAELGIEKTSLLASNGLLHEPMLEIVSKYLPG